MESYIKFKRILPPILWSILILVLLKYLLPLTFPVLLGLTGAAALSPLIRHLQKRLELRYNTAAALCVSGVLGLVIIMVFLLGRFLVSEMTDLYQSLPAILASLQDYAAGFSRWANHLAESLPGGAGDAFRDWADNILSSGGTLASSLYEKLFSLVSGFLGRLPDNILFLLTLVLSSYFAAAELPRLRALLREHLPRKRWQQMAALGCSVKSVLGSWARAQVKLMGITFLILLTGFLLLGVRFPLFLALGVALLDALPLFGTGTILLPWGLLSIISGNIRLGIGLIILYGAAALCRNILEPKFLGAQMGVSPLLTLLAIYVGYRISGITGMLLLPIFVMLGAEVLEDRKRPQSIGADIPQTGFAQRAAESHKYTSNS